MDTNGVVDTFYFGSNATFTAATKSKADSSLLNVDGSRINKGVDRYIWIKDDDGLLRGNSNKDSLGNPKKFVVFADSAPPAPDVDKDKLGSGVINIKWSNEDAKDGQQTQYAIVLGNSSGVLTDTLVNFTSGTSSSFSKAGVWYNYQFNATTRGYTANLYYMVIARDARGTKSRSQNGLGSLISAPY